MDSLLDSFFSSPISPDFRLLWDCIFPWTWRKFLAGPRNSLVVLMGLLGGSVSWVSDT